MLPSIGQDAVDRGEANPNIVGDRLAQRVSPRLSGSSHVQSPSRLGEARLYLASRQPVELPIPASTHLLRESSQIQGFISRTKAKPHDQIAGDYCDLLSRWVKEWQSHRRARWKCGSQKLDVAPSRLTTTSSHLTNGIMAAARIRAQSQQ